MRSNTQQVLPSNNKLALDRTVLTNDRTSQSWIHTGLVLLGLLSAIYFINQL